jgi:hypothetical protein
MPVCGPANRVTAVLHDYNSVSVGQCESLIAKSGEHLAHLRQLRFVKGLDGNSRQRVDERKKLAGTMTVIAPQTIRGLPR